MGLQVALTGGTGFVGSYILSELCKLGHDVRALVRKFPTDLEFHDNAPELVIGNLNDRAALDYLCDGADVVIHCAGLVAATSTQAFHDVNCDGVARLVEVAQRQKVGRFLLVSSMAGRAPGLSPYARSKAAGEGALKDRAGAMDWAIIRPPAVYGPGDLEVMRLVQAADKGWLPTAASSEARTSIIHASDLASFIVSLVVSQGDIKATFEPDDGKPSGYSWAELAQFMSLALGDSVRLVHLPRSLFIAVAGVSALVAKVKGKPTTFTPGKARELSYHDWVSRQDAFGEHTNWGPAISLQQGFAATVKWGRARGLLSKP